MSFNTNEGSTVEAITQDYATTITEPISPTKEGYTFAGWFRDETLITSYTFSTMPAENITLYSKWNPTINVVQYVLNDGQDDITSIAYSDSELLIPIRESYTFDGWYIDQSLTIKYDLGTFPKSNMTLYAKWIFNE